MFEQLSLYLSGPSGVKLNLVLGSGKTENKEMAVFTLEALKLGQSCLEMILITSGMKTVSKTDDFNI